MRRLFLDNAATSFPKPPGVHRAMLAYATEGGASPGRGSYAEAVAGAKLIAQCRERIRRLINGEAPRQVVFTLNTTDALNLAVKGVIRSARRAGARRPHVVASCMDHNSVLRQLTTLESTGDIDWTCIDADPQTGRIDPIRIDQAVRPETVLVTLNHASNVSGIIQDAGAVGEICNRRGVLFLLDAAQSLGHVPLDVQAIRADLLAFPGHKGLLGPQGTGGLYLRPGIEDRVDTIREGGTGHGLDRHPQNMPEKFEAGSHNTTGIAGLSEGVAWLLDQGLDAVRANEIELIGLLQEEFEKTPGLRVIGPSDPNDRIGVFTVVHRAWQPADMSAVLEQEFGILSRAGLHCAPRAHQLFGTAPRGGTRIALGPFVTADDVRFVGEAMRTLAAEPAGTRAGG